jgi:cytoskeletal protein CcmA (bactofilin family)
MRRSLPLAAALLLAICGCVNAADNDTDGDGASRVNGSIHVPDGAQRSDLSTVNGSIYIGNAATIAAAHTVNGAINLGARSKAASLNTVNGSITLAPGAQVSATVESVNGALTLHNDAEVAGSLMNVNGLIELTAAHVGGGLQTVNGDVTLSGASHVDGGILVKKPSGSHNFEDHVPRIVIGPGTTVAGSLRFEREVKLYVSDRATIGAVTGATPIRFSGESAPLNL